MNKRMPNPADRVVKDPVYGYGCMNPVDFYPGIQYPFRKARLSSRPENESAAMAIPKTGWVPGKRVGFIHIMKPSALLMVPYCLTEVSR
jgi:hypothetical protein